MQIFNLLLLPSLFSASLFLIVWWIAMWHLFDLLPFFGHWSDVEPLFIKSMIMTISSFVLLIILLFLYFGSAFIGPVFGNKAGAFMMALAPIIFSLLNLTEGFSSQHYSGYTHYQCIETIKSTISAKETLLFRLFYFSNPILFLVFLGIFYGFGFYYF